MIVLKTPDGKKVVLNSSTDECLYRAPQNVNGIDTTRGTDLYRHVSRKGNVYYYFYHWSMWQGESCDYQLISEEKAKEFLLENAGFSYPWGLSDRERKRAEELFPGIFEEDA